MFIQLVYGWDYLLYVQYWPALWIERSHLNDTGFTNDYFDIHGIWPEYYNGSYPSYCNKSAIFNVQVLKSIYTNLTKYWTDYRNAETFWKHEFYKHATCLGPNNIFRSEFDFFNNGLILRNKYNLFEILSRNNIYPSNVNKYSKNNIFNAVKSFINYEVAITCDHKKAILNEIIICMDAKLNLINCPRMHNDCNHEYIFINMVNPN